MLTRKTLRAIILGMCLSISPAGWAQQPTARWNLLEGIEPNYARFKEFEIGNRIVYWYRRKLGEATVERDQIVYWFARDTLELTMVKTDWREDLPSSLPKLRITQEDAESMVKGMVEFSKLKIISPESDVYPIDPTPTNPCWVVTSIDSEQGMIKTIIDAVEGTVLGYGISPPYYNGFALDGPCSDPPSCTPCWMSWREDAANWFEEMGYPTQEISKPFEYWVKAHIQSCQTAMFYELCHGSSFGFQNYCNENTTDVTLAWEIEEWIEHYPKMPFAFIGSCDGMCDTNDNTLSYEFRKGSAEDTATVGHCGMGDPNCSDCFEDSLEWQRVLFSHMSDGNTVKEAFDAADACFPDCYNNKCMRFAGDEDFAVVPVVKRAEVTNLTANKVYSSIQSAIDDANDSDVVQLCLGVHHETIDFKGKAITLRSTDPNDSWVVDRTIIDADQASVAVHLDANAVLEGLTITDSNSSGIRVLLSSPTIRKCTIKSNAGCGVYCLGSGTAPVIENNIIRLNDGVGIHCASSTAPTIKNNYIHWNTGGVLTVLAGSTTIRNDTVWSNVVYGIKAIGPAPTITNCIIWDCNDDLSNCTATYSCISDCNDANGTGNICGDANDPNFAIPGRPDCHLSPGSPCVDAGDPNCSTPAGETDIDGEPRVMDVNGGKTYPDSIIDIGADEVSCYVHNLSQDTWYVLSIQEAIDDAASDDVVEVYQNTYREQIDFKGKAITVRSTDPNDWDVVESTIITYATGTEPNKLVEFSSGEGPNSVLSGFAVQGQPYLNNKLDAAVYCSASSPTITNCLVRSKTDRAAAVYCHTGAPVITNNRLGQNRNGVECFFVEQIHIANNWMYDNALCGIYAREPNDQMRIFNNTIIGTQIGGIYCYSGVAPEVSNCILWENNDDLYGCTATYSCIQDGDTGTGNISSDPCFVDADANDFHLSSDSPCINRGDPSGSYSGETDIDGDDRVIKGRVDIGADEKPFPVHNLDKDKGYLTIQAAVDDADPGDEILADQGTYLENIDFKGKAITLRGSDPNDWEVVAATIIDANGASKAVYFHTSEGSNSILRGFTLTNADYGVYCSSASPTISECAIKDNTYYGAYLASSSATVTNNWIYDNGYRGITTYNSASAELRNNTIVGNGLAGVYAISGNPDITNCILWDNGDDLYGCTATYSCIQDGDSGTGNISSDPCFVDADANDFHLAPDSPCANAGDPNGDYPSETDIDGQPRIMRGRVDMGADEVLPVTYYVDPCGDDSNGLSWVHAFNTIQQGIDAANATLVEVNEATYYETIDFNGVACTVTSTDPNDWSVVAATIIDADGAHQAVWFHNSEDANSILRGFTITGADHGIYCNSASPVIENCLITDNEDTGDDGAGMYNYKASPTVNACVFYHNDADYGGGMCNYNHSSPTVTNCLFNDNEADECGGGMYNNYDSCPTIVNCTFFENDAGDGDGICNEEDSDAQLTNCIFWDNYEEIYNDDSEPNFSYCCIRGELNGTECGGDPSIDGGGNIDDDPQFEDDTDPEGTDNIWATCDDGLRLDSTSPCKDEGYNAAVPQDVDTDIKGSDRIINGDVDMGAYEYDSGC
ncbi:MAG: right-handed parallel beta-helix repeat-containing protein [Planctomycetota bacterium]|jgi:parallel beta-helix repeat protein